MHEPRPRTTNRPFVALIIGLGALLSACQQTPPSTTIAIAVNPNQAELAPSEPREFTATTAGTSNTNVTWTTTCGTIDGDGTTITYTAPTADGTCTLTATSTADPSKTATATITIDATVLGVSSVGVRVEVDVVHVSAGGARTLALDRRGYVWAWGHNDFGQVGDGTTTPRDTPVPVCATGSGATCERLELGVGGSVSGASAHSLAVGGDGRVWAWGSNSNGQLGDGTTDQRNHPTAVCAHGSATDACVQLSLGAGGTVHAGNSSSLAVDGSGNVWAWGLNGNGQLGVGTSFPDDVRILPVPVCASGTGASCVQLNLGSTGAISVGNAHVLAVNDSGDVWAWGSNQSGKLGDGTVFQRPRPVPVCATGTGASCVQLNVGSARALSAGGNHSLVADGGGVWAWGRNVDGRLGDGTTENRPNPVPVLLP